MTRIAMLGDQAGFVTEMVDMSVRGLTPGYVKGDREFVFTRRGKQQADGSWVAEPEGRSVRYSAIVALGLATVPEARQRAALAGDSLAELVDALVDRLPSVTNLGDVGLICWAAAETGSDRVAEALARLAEVDVAGAVYTVEASWVLAALAAAKVTDDRYKAARSRIVDNIGAGGLYPHVIGQDASQPWYRGHVGCFADQVYPIQALARAGDAEAVKTAELVADRICQAQGPEGQWWWHYDSRDGSVVEGYPVYSVHQLSMGPMALLDLMEAGGRNRIEEIELGLRWMHERPETQEKLVFDDLTWRKAARQDPKKLVRGVRAAATRLKKGTRVAVLDRVYPPVAVDRECRPYELGWLLYAWGFRLDSSRSQVE
ncbi:hypothetical protein [Nonomuraea soli]|uniref:Uncharacterized protein n=1 Tax=Nonomuraea soli TaxID=1032476 RepID=A0A7W0HWC5_9ACTN|nr:hypothetical protein [Nonomuraea soli]MBA2897952.1 hypothetical protein [Nonomuraea soli]